MSYFGLCIGGPLDGQYRSCNTKQFNVPVREPLPLVSDYPTGCEVANQSFTVTHYEHSLLRAPGATKTFDLWLHKGLSLAEALSMLQNAYHGAKVTTRHTGRTKHNEA